MGLDRERQRLTSNWLSPHGYSPPASGTLPTVSKSFDVLAVVALFFGGLLLFLTSLPIKGQITFIGGGRTDEEIKRSERWHKAQRWAGLFLLLAGSVVQVLIAELGSSAHFLVSRSRRA